MLGDPPGSPRTQLSGERISPEQFFRDINYVTLKLTNGCNLKCSYCNVEADHPSTPKMSIDVFKRVCDVYIPSSTSKYLGLEFHGGEPLLLPDEWFKEAVGYAGMLARRHGKVMQHPMQTNGTLLSVEREKLLRGLGIDIGFSFDGTPEINDRLRMAGTTVEKTIRRVAASGQRLGLILVLGRHNCNDMFEVMEYFRRSGIDDFRVNFLQPQGWGMQQDVLSADEMFTGMKTIFEHMHDTECSVFEAETEMAVNRMIEGRDKKPGLSCWELECQAGRSYCAVNDKGGVHACGTDMSQHRLGDVFDGFDAGHVKQTLAKLHKKDAWYVRCFDCEAKRICHYSCPTSDFNTPTYRDEACSFTRKIYA